MERTLFILRQSHAYHQSITFILTPSLPSRSPDALLRPLPSHSMSALLCCNPVIPADAICWNANPWHSLICAAPVQASVAAVSSCVQWPCRIRRRRYCSNTSSLSRSHSLPTFSSLFRRTRARCPSQGWTLSCHLFLVRWQTTSFRINWWSWERRLSGRAWKKP